MKELTLCFPSFYHCAVKDNSHMLQYNAVSILLTGEVRNEKSKNYISDAAASNYIKGKKSIPDEILTPLLRCSETDIIDRLRRLDIQNIQTVTTSLTNLLAIASNISQQEKRTLYRLLSEPNHDYTFIAKVFLAALKCPASLTCHIDKAMLTSIRGLRTARMPESFIGRDVNETDVFDISQSISLLHTQISYPHDYSRTIAYFDLEQTERNGWMSLDEANVLVIFSFGTQEYNYYLTTLTGPANGLTAYMRQFRLFQGSPAMLFLLEYPDNVLLDSVESICQSVKEQFSQDSFFVFGCNHREDLPPSVCKAKILYCQSKTQSIPFF